MIKINDQSFCTQWSDKDKEFIGLCMKFPSLSWLAKTKNEAIRGIKELVNDVIKDIKINGM